MNDFTTASTRALVRLVRCLYVGTSVLALGIANSVMAEPIWHCSRVVVAQSPTNQTATQSIGGMRFNFSSSNTIELDLSDLYGVYSGEPIRLGGRPLSACYFSPDYSISTQVSDSFGFNPSTLAIAVKNSSPEEVHTYRVDDESQMEQCIQAHHPAVGYLSEVKETEKIAPCF